MKSPLMALVLLAACGEPAPDPKKGGEVVDPISPGTRTMPRLTATEYDSVVRDLLQTDQRPGRTFPADEIELGFDNIAAALTTSVTHVGLWETAADTLLDEMFVQTVEETVTTSVQAEGAGVVFEGDGAPYEETGYQLRDGSMSVTTDLAYDGTFQIIVGASAQSSAGTPAMQVRVDGVVITTFSVTDAIGQTGKYSAETTLDDGTHTFEVAFLNPDGEMLLVLDYLQVKGPTDPVTQQSAAYDTYVGCGPDGLPDRACAEQAIGAFGRAAWRRPLTAEEISQVLEAYDEAVALELDGGEALQHAFKTILMSPDFLYRIEQDPTDGAQQRALDGFEVASRLAAFLWASTPDEELLDAAQAGTLSDPAVLDAQIERMVADERGSALVDNLAAQWFLIRNLDIVAPNIEVYPEWDEELRASMQGELALRLREFFREQAPVSDLVKSQYGWVDERLAAEYGLPYEGDGEFVRTPLVGFDRYGLLGSAGFLVATSRPDAPSAVKRGKWILENLLCSSPPPPPPNVESELNLVEVDGSVRLQEEAQRSDAFCQTCHSLMDPLGFTLHGFDGIGMQRSDDEFGFPVDDATAFLGTALDGPQGLADFVEADPRFSQCVVEKTFTYALGRGVEIDDAATIESITAEFLANGRTFDALAKAIVKSDAFLLRGAPEVE